jgi:hypothetical protein
MMHAVQFTVSAMDPPSAIPHLRDWLRNLLLYFALLGIAAGVLVGFLLPHIGEGNGILAATFFGVTGYIVTLLYQGMENREAVAIACYATVKSQFMAARDAMGPAELRNSREKSLEIAAGRKEPSFGSVAADPYRFLPAHPEGVRELRAETIKLLGNWYVQDQELGIYWEVLETAAFVALGPVRIIAYYDWIEHTVWPRYQELSKATLIALASEIPRMRLEAEIQALFTASGE